MASSGSDFAMTRYDTSKSIIFAAIGPATNVDFAGVAYGLVLTLPCVVFNPYRPVHADGSLIDPPPSQPKANGIRPEATALELPLDDTPG